MVAHAISVGALSPTTWLWLALAAMLVGVAKTAISGVGSIAVVIFAVVLPARESTGAILPLLLFGDVVAVSYYRRHADWGVLWRLLLGVVPGLVVGAWFLAVVDDSQMRTAIAAILLVMCGIQLWQRAQPASVTEERPAHPHGLLTLAMGAAAGFATMTANAAGPVTTLYLIMAGLPMLQLLGTGAWFYLVVNLAKVPVSLGLGLMSVSSLSMDLLLVPAMLAGAALGVSVIRRIRQRQFELVALGFSAVSAALLLVR